MSKILVVLALHKKEYRSLSIEIDRIVFELWKNLFTDDSEIQNKYIPIARL